MERQSETWRGLFQNKINLRYCASACFYYISLLMFTTISELILISHNSLSLFCIIRALLLSEEKLYPTIPLSSSNTLYEQCADFLCSSSCLLLWLFTHQVTANRFIRIKYEFWIKFINPLNPTLNPICYLLALLGAHHFLHVSRIRVKLLTFRLLMSYIYIYIYIWSTHSWCF